MTHSIDLQANLDDYFRAALDGALRAQRTELTCAGHSYVATLLQQQALPSAKRQDAERPYTLRLEAALSLPNAAERFEGLRALGDDVLYQLGFFGDQFEARGVAPEYLIGLGQSAYARAGALLTPASARSVEDAASEPLDLFAELADKFGKLVVVLGSLAEQVAASAAGTAQSVVQLYERWLRTRSPALGDALLRHGFIAPRGRGEVQ